MKNLINIQCSSASILKFFRNFSESLFWIYEHIQSMAKGFAMPVFSPMVFFWVYGEGGIGGAGWARNAEMHYATCSREAPRH